MINDDDDDCDDNDIDDDDDDDDNVNDDNDDDDDDDDDKFQRCVELKKSTCVDIKLILCFISLKIINKIQAEEEELLLLFIKIIPSWFHWFHHYILLLQVYARTLLTWKALCVRMCVHAYVVCTYWTQKETQHF